jgi:thiol:disulfide interchange protein DsbD
MRRLPSIFVVVSLLAAAVPALAVSSAADAPHVRVELLVLPQSLNRGEAADAGLYFKLEPGWHVYWLNPGDAGLPPHARWTLPAGISAGPLQFPAPKRLPLGPLMDFGYENEVLFPLTLNVSQSASPGQAVVHAKVDWLVCSDRCIPGKAELEVSRNVLDRPANAVSLASDAVLFKKFAALLPKPLPAGVKAGFQAAGAGFRLTVETGGRETRAEFFPAEESILDNPAPQKLTPTAKGLILEFKKDANLASAPARLKGVLELSGGRTYEIAALPGPPSAAAAQAAAPAAQTPQANPGVRAAAASAGTQAASSPAPVSPPEANPSETVGKTSSPALIPAASGPGLGLLRSAGLAFVGGLLLNLMPCVFPVLFLKGLALVNSGHREQGRMRAHGLVYAAGILVSFWVLVGVLLGLRAAGATLGWGFQFQSPVFLSLMAGLLFFLGLSLAGQFEIGLTLTSAGGSLAAKQGYAGSFFTGVLAVVVATPCTAPFMGAAIGYALAQPAAVTFAVFTALALGLAAPYVALTLQPAWTRLLPRPGVWMEVLRQAVSVPIFATVIWLAWVLAQAYGASVLALLLASFLLLAIAGWFLGRWPAKRWSTAVAAVIVVAATGLGVYSQAVVVPRFSPDRVLTVQLAPGTYWQEWSAEAVSRYRAEGRPVLVDFTASWCLSCQVNERVALNQPEVKRALRDAKVALLRADWTRHDEAITQALTALGRSGVPAYALYVPGETSPRLLPEVLTPGIVIDALSNLPKPPTQPNASASKLK